MCVGTQKWQRDGKRGRKEDIKMTKTCARVK